MSGIIEGIGVISGVLGIVSFGMDLFGDSSSSSTSVRIAAALNGEEGLSNADGSVAQIRTLNAEEQLLGIGPETYISSGDYADVSVPQSNKQQAVFIELHASDDAVCIAYVSTTWADGSQWLWLGDFGKACDLKWYWSGVRAGKEEDGSSHETKCTWIDADGSIKKRHGKLNELAASLTLGISEFGDRSVEGDDPDSMCGHPAMRAYKESDGSDPIFDRDVRPRDSRIVVTDFPSHNATELCGSATSWGPDLVSLSEGRYCDMESRQVYPLCDGLAKTECFEIESMHIIGEGRKHAKKVRSKTIMWKKE